MSSRLLTLEHILAASDLEQREVEVPEWGGSVRVKGMSKRDQQALRRAATVGGVMDPDRLELLLLVHGLAEPALTVEQAEQLAGKSAAGFDRVLKEIMALNGMTEQAQTEALRTFRAGDAGP